MLEPTNHSGLPRTPSADLAKGDPELELESARFQNVHRAFGLVEGVGDWGLKERLTREFRDWIESDEEASEVLVPLQKLSRYFPLPISARLLTFSFLENSLASGRGLGVILQDLNSLAESSLMPTSIASHRVLSTELVHRLRGETVSSLDLVSIAHEFRWAGNSPFARRGETAALHLLFKERSGEPLGNDELSSELLDAVGNSWIPFGELLSVATDESHSIDKTTQLVRKLLGWNSGASAFGERPDVIDAACHSLHRNFSIWKEQSADLGNFFDLYQAIWSELPKPRHSVSTFRNVDELVDLLTETETSLDSVAKKQFLQEASGFGCSTLSRGLIGNVLQENLSFQVSDGIFGERAAYYLLRAFEREGISPDSITPDLTAAYSQSGLSLRRANGTKAVVETRRLLEKAEVDPIILPALLSGFGVTLLEPSNREFVAELCVACLNLGQEISLICHHGREVLQLYKTLEYRTEDRRLEFVDIVRDVWQGELKRSYTFGLSSTEKSRLEDEIFTHALKTIWMDRESMCSSGLSLRENTLKKRIQGVEKNVDLLLTTEDSQSTEFADLKKLVEVFSAADSVPTRYHLDKKEKDPNPLAQQISDQAVEIRLRALDIYNGFGALALDSRPTPLKRESALVQFGIDSSPGVASVHASTSEEFPGRGFVISNLEVKRIFAEDLKFQEAGKADSLWRWREELIPWAGDALNDLPDIRFMFTRGLIAMTYYGASDRYALRGTPYTSVFYNSHFCPDPLNRAYLIPTEVFDAQVASSIGSSKDGHGNRVDLNDEKVSVAALSRRWREIKLDRPEMLPILNVASGSNIGGGLCNAFPVGSSPFHTWETWLKKEETRDIWGHPHKSHFNGGYRARLTPELDRDLEPLREAHHGVYRISKGYHDAFNLFRVGFSLWKSGQTLERNKAEEFDLEQSSGNAGNDSDQMGKRSKRKQVLEDDGGGIRSRGHKMLQYAQDWHVGYQVGLVSKQECPILVRAPILSYGAQPEIDFYLDTADRRVRLPSGEMFSLPGRDDSLGIEAALTWDRKIAPLLAGGQHEFRLYLRDTFPDFDKEK